MRWSIVCSRSVLAGCLLGLGGSGCARASLRWASEQEVAGDTKALAVVPAACAEGRSAGGWNVIAWSNRGGLALVEGGRERIEGCGEVVARLGAADRIHKLVPERLLGELEQSGPALSLLVRIDVGAAPPQEGERRSALQRAGFRIGSASGDVVTGTIDAGALEPLLDLSWVMTIEPAISAFPRPRSANTSGLRRALSIRRAGEGRARRAGERDAIPTSSPTVIAWASCSVRAPTR